MITDHRQLDQLVQAMFHHDGRGRLTGASPLMHIVRTDDHVVWRCREDVPEATAAEIEAVAIAPRGRPGAWADDYAAYLSLVRSVATETSIRAGPLFRFPAELPEPTDCSTINATNLHLLEGTLDEWVQDAESGSLMTAALADGKAVSVCATVRSSSTVHCAGVETAAAYRGRGFAERAVAAWSKRVRARGAEPFYGTTFDNVPSQKVAWRLGLELVGSEFSVYGATFGQDAG